MKKEYDFKKMKRRPGKVKVDLGADKIMISLRMEANDLVDIRTEAYKMGLPYQTLIGSILHQYVTGELIPKKMLEYLKASKVS